MKDLAYIFKQYQLKEALQRYQINDDQQSTWYNHLPTLIQYNSVYNNQESTLEIIKHINFLYGFTMGLPYDKAKYYWQSCKAFNGKTQTPEFRQLRAQLQLRTIVM